LTVSVAVGRLAVVPACLAMGTVAAFSTKAGLLCFAALILLLVMTIRGEKLWWDLALVSFAGPVLLDYGFANAGFRSPLPIPLSAVILAAAVVGAVLASQPRLPEGVPFLLAGALFLIMTARLLIDYPVWGTTALRDYSIAYELAYLLAGYWAVSVFGVARWVRGLTWVFVPCLAYSALYPWRDALVSVSPDVGLQRSVPLFGNYVAAGAAAAAGLFFFALVRPLGRASYPLAVAFVPILLLHQSRGLYLAVPAAALALVVMAAGAPAARVRRALGISLVVGALAGAMVMAVEPAGRLGPVSPDFVEAQLVTLAGDEGPSAGSVRDRAAWFNQTLDDVHAHDYGWLVGVGLGPDLAGGFRSVAVAWAGGTEQVLARKPHNDYLEMYARAGLPGLLSFVGLLVAGAWAIIRGARRASGIEARFLWWALAVVIVYGALAATQPLMAYSYGTAPLFITIGAALALVRGRDRSAGANGHSAVAAPG
jgi:hypothetical protein